MSFGCLWMCGQILEELPLEFHAASQSASIFGSTGLPILSSRCGAITPALYAFIDGGCDESQISSDLLGSPRYSKSIRSFHIEHTFAANVGMS